MVFPSLLFQLDTWLEALFGKLWRMGRKRLCMLWILTTREKCKQKQHNFWMFTGVSFSSLWPVSLPDISTAAHWRVSVVPPCWLQTLSMLHTSNHDANKEMSSCSVSTVHVHVMWCSFCHSTICLASNYNIHRVKSQISESVYVSFSLLKPMWWRPCVVTVMSLLPWIQLGVCWSLLSSWTRFGGQKTLGWEFTRLHCLTMSATMWWSSPSPRYP